MPSPSTVAESDCNAESEYDVRVRLQCRVRVVWPSDLRPNTSDVSESSWPSPTCCPKHPGRVRLAGRMNFSRVTFNRVNLAESEWSGRMTEYDWLVE